MESIRTRYENLSHGKDSQTYRDYPIFLAFETEAKAILSDVPQDRAVSIALAASQEIGLGGGKPQIPAIIIFNYEGHDPDTVWRRLTDAMRTPDYDTPAFTPELRDPIDRLKEIFYMRDYTDGYFAGLVADHVIRVAGGDPAAIFSVYQDNGRRYPVNSADWYEELERQFEGVLFQSENASDAEKEFLSLLGDSDNLAKKHRALHKKQMDGEDTFSYLVRTLGELGDHFDMTTEAGIISAGNTLDRLWRDYRREAYALRGIPYEY